MPSFVLITRVLVIAALLAAGAPAAAQSADLSQIWRGGLANARDLFRHPQMAAALDRLLGARKADFIAASATPDLLERFMGQVVVGRACAATCAAAGVFVVADTNRGEILLVLADRRKSGAGRFERFETAHMPMPSEPVLAALDKWKETYAER